MVSSLFASFSHGQQELELGYHAVIVLVHALEELGGRGGAAQVLQHALQLLHGDEVALVDVVEVEDRRVLHDLVRSEAQLFDRSGGFDLGVANAEEHCGMVLLLRLLQCPESHHCCQLGVLHRYSGVYDGGDRGHEVFLLLRVHEGALHPADERNGVLHPNVLQHRSDDHARAAVPASAMN